MLHVAAPAPITLAQHSGRSAPAAPQKFAAVAGAAGAAARLVVAVAGANYCSGRLGRLVADWQVRQAFGNNS